MGNINGKNVLTIIKTERIGINDVLDIVYPIGSIYMSVNSTSPQTFIGGIWERIQDRFLLSAGTTYSAGTTGGEATHTLTVNEMPSHNHLVRTALHNNDWGGNSGQVLNRINNYFFEYNSSGLNYSYNARENLASVEYMHNGYAADAGGGQAHNNMPPYLAVYMWKRTA